MDKRDTDFETWFYCLAVQLLDEGIDFNDEESVRDEYNNGADMFDVIDAIVKEY